MWQVLICKVCSTCHSTQTHTCIRHVTHNNWCRNDLIIVFLKIWGMKKSIRRHLCDSQPSYDENNPFSYTSINLYAVSFILKFFTPSHPNISMHILHTVLYTFPKVLTRRICPSIKSFFSWWSFTLFSWPYILIQGWYCVEKLIATYSWKSNGY